MCQPGGTPELSSDVEAPTQLKSPSESREAQSFTQRIQNAKNVLKRRENWIGDYDYKALCMPRIPFIKRSNRSIFFGLNDRIPILVALVMGFQHSLAMASGVASVPRILTGGGLLSFPPSQASYVIFTSLTVCGFMSLIQIIRFRLVRGYYIGTGMVSMSGTSFTFLPVVDIVSRMREEGKCGDPSAFESCQRSVYGKWLGTAAVASLIEIGVSFLPPSVLTSLFPPVVSGCTVFLIGASLIGVGIRYWAGGVGPCYNYAKIKLLGGKQSDSLAFFANCPSLFGPSMQFPWGDSRWVGLGFFVFSIIMISGIFGSPFLRNIQVMVGLIAGIILAAATRYMDQDFIDSSPMITFPFVETFPLSVYWPAVIPTMIGYLVSAVDTVGDISATAELSRVATEGSEFESRVQGGLLADGVNSLLATLLTTSPTATFPKTTELLL